MRHFWMSCKLFSRISKEKSWLGKCGFSLLFGCFEIFKALPGNFLFFLPRMDGGWFWFYFALGRRAAACFLAAGSEKWRTCGFQSIGKSLRQQLSDGLAFYLCWFCRRLGNNRSFRELVLF